MKNSYYKHIIIETYEPQNENSSSKVRAHPVAGQGLDENLNVECSKKMRLSHPVGTRFKIKAKISDREGTPFIYCKPQESFEIVSDKMADIFIKENNMKKI